ncbi:MAG: cell division protein FtsQ/DivIB [Chloroflexota bacterium]|nr:cell division protein FtsQ/DivIB [Chloroflexota bacterium]
MSSALVLGRARAGQRTKARDLVLATRNLLLLLLVVVIVGGLWLALDDRFYVYHADVTGAGRVSPDEVFRASGLLGLHALWVRPAAVEARILAELPSFESARVACGVLDEECTIAVVERQPRVAWDEDGKLWWIDADGIIFPAPEALAEGWLVQGPLPRDGDGRLDERVRVALSELWLVGADVSRLLYVPDRGLTCTNERGWRIILGQGPGMAERWRALKLLTGDLEVRGLTPRFVDVRFPDAPYYSLTNEW